MPIVPSGYRTEYERLWETLEVRRERRAEVGRVCSLICAHKERYARVSVAVSDEPHRIPWQVIGAVHLLETGLRFDLHLHNGDPLTARTVHVPVGRPKVGVPPFSGEQSARDALLGRCDRDTNTEHRNPGRLINTVNLPQTGLWLDRHLTPLLIQRAVIREASITKLGNIPSRQEQGAGEALLGKAEPRGVPSHLTGGLIQHLIDHGHSFGPTGLKRDKGGAIRSRNIESSPAGARPAQSCMKASVRRRNFR